jgi:hypothetical protein
VARSLSEALSVKPAAFRWLSTSWPKARERTTKAAIAARTRFGWFQVRSAIQVKARRAYQISKRMLGIPK